MFSRTGVARFASPLMVCNSDLWLPYYSTKFRQLVIACPCFLYGAALHIHSVPNRQGLELSKAFDRDFVDPKPRLAS